MRAYNDLKHFEGFPNHGFLFALIHRSQPIIISNEVIKEYVTQDNFELFAFIFKKTARLSTFLKNKSSNINETAFDRAKSSIRDRAQSSCCKKWRAFNKNNWAILFEIEEFRNIVKNKLIYFTILLFIMCAVFLHQMANMFL